MSDDKNPQDIKPTFLRKTPDGKTEAVDANGKPVEKASTRKADSEGGELKTGDLPKNTAGYGKLAAANITTYEALREATTEQLTAAGLDTEQIGKLDAVKTAQA